jgi:hypothetical protein
MEEALRDAKEAMGTEAGGKKPLARSRETPRQLSRSSPPQTALAPLLGHLPCVTGL